MKAGSGTSWVVWVVSIILLTLVGVLLAYSYANWPGARYFGIYDKKFWDYLELLIVPAALAIGAGALNSMQSKRATQTEENQQAREERIASQRVQDEALQAYLIQMGQLLLEKDRPLWKSVKMQTVATLARAWTLTVLETFDGSRQGQRKRRVLRFLYESGLIKEGNAVVELARADLSGADLRGAELSRANLSSADLSSTNLEDANLKCTNLKRTNLSGANLEGADLEDALLYETDLTEANLRNAEGVDIEALKRQACSLEGAIMPNGQKDKY